MRPARLLAAAAALALAGCAMNATNNPERDKQTVSMVNRLSWTNAMTGKPDGLRTAWPLSAMTGHVEQFPLTQLKQCRAGEALCHWGVMKASRTIGGVRYLPGGVEIDVTVAVDVARRQEGRWAGANTAMTIPADVPALSGNQRIHRTLIMEYGKTERIELDFGVAYTLCVSRLDETREPLEVCLIPYD